MSIPEKKTKLIKYDKTTTKVMIRVHKQFIRKLIKHKKIDSNSIKINKNGWKMSKRLNAKKID